jgi:hypothetical protein
MPGCCRMFRFIGMSLLRLQHFIYHGNQYYTILHFFKHRSSISISCVRVISLLLLLLLLLLLSSPDNLSKMVCAVQTCRNYLFLPSADSKAVCRRPRKHFLTPLPPSPLPTSLKVSCRKSPVTHLVTNDT